MGTQVTGKCRVVAWQDSVPSKVAKNVVSRNWKLKAEKRGFDGLVM